MNNDEISKIKDPRIIEARFLNTYKNRVESNKILLKGKDQVDWAEKFGLKIEYILVCKGSKSISFQYKYPVFTTSEGILKKVSGTNYLIPIIAVANKKIINREENAFTIVLDNLIDHGNIGTIVRTGYAYGVNNYVYTNKDMDFYYSKIIDASRGTVFNVHQKSLNSKPELIKYLRDNNYQIVATSPHGNRIQSLLNLKQKPIAVIFGNENSGVSSELIETADYVAKIPLVRDIESLNVGVSAGISIHELKSNEVFYMKESCVTESYIICLNEIIKSFTYKFSKRIGENTSYSANSIMVLILIFNFDKCKVADIAENILLPCEKVEQSICYLIEKELVKNVNDVLEVTYKGKTLISKIWPIYIKFEEEVFSGFSNKEKKEFQSFMARLKNNMKNI
jgi:TrmH family RNA methyltransferase